MVANNLAESIENGFRERVIKDKRIKNAYLLVHAERVGVYLNIAEGSTGTVPANPQQPNYMASVGKLFTATVIGMLSEEGKLSFEDRIGEYLDHELVNNLHVHKSKDYSDEMRIKHLLGHSSGLADNFRPLLDEVVEEPDHNLSPIDAIRWVKSNREAHFPPGKGFRYTDTNYHLLGLIIESITSEPFHAALHKYLFEPLDMRHSYMHQYSKPAEEPQFPTAGFYYRETRLNDVGGYGGLDYSGGGVVATTEDLLTFIKSLVAHRIVASDTLEEMKRSRARMGLGIGYGYGIWQITTVPLLMPKRLNSWGVAGATGSFMFYHPELDAFAIGNFNDFAYERSGLRFMLLDVFNRLAKHRG